MTEKHTTAPPPARPASTPAAGADRSGEPRSARMLWNTPLAPGHAELLLDSLAPHGRRITDLGCGWGELLLRAVESGGPEATGVGIDVDREALLRGQRLAAARGLESRVRFECTPAKSWRGDAERLICIGAAHAWGSAEVALQALTSLLAPGGRLLFGEGIWEREPTCAAETMFGHGLLPLAGLVRCAHESGWRVLHASTADQREWDVFEATFRAAPHEGLTAHPDGRDAETLRAALRQEIEDYLSVYRGLLGFAYLVLTR